MNATATNKGEYKEWYLQKLYPVSAAIIESHLFMVLYVLYCTVLQRQFLFRRKGTDVFVHKCDEKYFNNCNLKSLEWAVNDIYFNVSKLIKISNC